MIVWKVRIGKKVIVCDNFKEAYNIYQEDVSIQDETGDIVCIYPSFMRRSTYENLKEFTGW